MHTHSISSCTFCCVICILFSAICLWHIQQWSPDLKHEEEGAGKGGVISGKRKALCQGLEEVKTVVWRIFLKWGLCLLFCLYNLFLCPWNFCSVMTKEINPKYSLEGLMLKLKLQYFGHLMQRTDSLEKTLMLGKLEGRGRDNRGWDGWMASPTQWTWVWENLGRWWRTGKPGVLWFRGLQWVGHNLGAEQQ